jgi:Na+-driven multidrug efflux pump
LEINPLITEGDEDTETSI